MTIPYSSQVLKIAAQEFGEHLPTQSANGIPLGPGAGSSEATAGIAQREKTGFEEITECPILFGVSPRVYRQINALIKSGKKHLIFHGPPGTGKTTLAEHVATILSNDGEFEFVTGSSNIESDYLVGGYQPVGKGEVEFRPGLILQKRDIPMVFDEMNRCEIDAALGPLFSVLNDVSTTLPMLAFPSRPASPVVTIEPGQITDAENGIYGLGEDWRLIATMNTIDRTQLNQLSYALSRRFGWIYIGIPEDLNALIKHLAAERGLFVPPDEQLALSPIAEVWNVINEVRPLGGAPFKDVIKVIKEIDAGADLFSTPANEPLKEALVDGLHSLVAPLLGGLPSTDVDKVIEAVSKSFAIDVHTPSMKDFARTLRDSQI